MDHARRTRLVVACLGVVVLMCAIEASTTPFLCWPAAGFAAAAAVLCPRRRRWLLLGGLCLAVVVVLSLADRAVDVSIPLLGSVLPAAVLGLYLAHDDGHVEIDEPRPRVRYEGALIALGIVAGLVTTLSLLRSEGPMDAATLGLAGALAAVAPTQVALALLLPRGSDRPLAGEVELWLVRVSLAAGTAAVVLSGLTVVLFLVLAVFGWAAARMARREAVVHLAVFSVVNYFGSFAPVGVLTAITRDPGSALAPGLVVAYLAGCGYLVVPLATAMERLKATLIREKTLADTNRRLFNAPTSTMIVTTDERRRITSFDRGAEGVMGWSASEVLGRSPELFHPPDTVADVARRLGCESDFGLVSLRQMETGTAETWGYVAKDGRRGVVRLAIHPVLDPTTGDVIGSFAIGDDVTDQERTREALDDALRHEQTSRERLKEADDLKHGLVANVSHELRTPVTSMRGYAELIGDGTLGEVTEHQRDAVERILRNADRLTHLVDDLIALAGPRGDAHGLDPVDLAGVVEEVAGHHRRGRTVTERALRVRRGAGSLLVRGDPDDLRRIVSNLVSNAVKFTPDGGEIDVDVQHRGDSVVLTVTDTGVGIAPADQEQLFQRFFRARAATEGAVQGSGVGLSTVHTLVTALGGTIEVRSALARGTTVLVTLPAAGPGSGERHDEHDPGGRRAGDQHERPHARRGDAVAQQT